MKKILSLIIIQMVLAFAAVTSCQQFNELLIDDSGKIFATTESATKTSLGDDWSVLWQSSDRIAVFNGNTSPSCYKVAEGAGTASAVFSAVKTSSQGALLSTKIAIYPYDDSMKASSDGTITLTIPSTQKYIAGGFAPETNYMAAATEDTESNSFAFKNLLSIIRVSLTGSDIIQKLEFSGNNNESICGKATVKPVFGKAPALSFTSGAGKVLTLDCGEGVKLSSKPTEFFIAVPPMQFKNGFKVIATSVAGSSITMNVSESTTFKRSNLKTAPAKEFKPQQNDGFVHFESPEFEAYCIEEFDIDGDGCLSEKEASKVTTINLLYTDIDFTSLRGIEYFVNLETLYASGNYYSYDENGNELWLSRKQKISETVDLTKNTKLRALELQNHQINEVKLSPSKSLQYLNLSENHISILDVSQFPFLQELMINDNRITEIDLSQNKNLISLAANQNFLTTIDLSHCPLLSFLALGQNLLTEIDLSDNTELITLLLFRNNFSYIDISRLNKLSYLECTENPNLKYILINESQDITTSYYPKQAEILKGDLFNITPQTCEVNPQGDLLQIEVTSTTDSHLSSAPEWISLSGTKKNGLITTYIFMVQSNLTSEDRNGLIVLCSDSGTCHPVSVTQKRKEDIKDVDWRETDFYHRSLMMRFTATWCTYCPWMAEAITIAQDKYPNKIEAISMHGSGDLFFNDVSEFEKMFGVNSYPSGIVDCRRFIENSSPNETTANNIIKSMNETEANYPAATGISYTSSITDKKINVDVSVYAKAAEEFKITVLLLEDNVVAAQTGADPGYIHNDVPRLTLSNSIVGDMFTVSASNTAVPLHFSGEVPSNCNINNCRILIFIQRQYGSQRVIQDSGLGNWYVDNCVSGKAAGSVPLILVDNSNSPSIGNNENITPGDDINF